MLHDTGIFPLLAWWRFFFRVFCFALEEENWRLFTWTIMKLNIEFSVLFHRVRLKVPSSSVNLLPTIQHLSRLGKLKLQEKLRKLCHMQPTSCTWAQMICCSIFRTWTWIALEKGEILILPNKTVPVSTFHVIPQTC